MDHLEGILFIDYLSKLKKSMIVKKLSKSKKNSETLNFILITLNQLDLDQIRNKIILKTLPIRV